jgi:arginase family enzyme
MVAGGSEQNSAWLAVDSAWDFASKEKLPRRVEAAEMGKALRFLTSKKQIKRFSQQFAPQIRPFTLSGSGDFHHLTAVLVRQISEPFVIVSFDNHPDWDIRPPHWCCGAWVNRALENPLIERIAVWGCASFECLFPGRLLGNSASCKSGRLRVFPWAKEGAKYPSWLQPISDTSWRTEFMHFAETLRDSNVYVTVDMDCLIETDAVTNWESGRYTLEEITWAVSLLRSKANVVGGDLCGAYSAPQYAGGFQRIASKFDHPRRPVVSDERINSVNGRAYQAIWPVLVGA